MVEWIYASIYTRVIGTVVEWIYASIYSMGAVDNLVIGTVVEWIYASIYTREQWTIWS